MSVFDDIPFSFSSRFPFFRRCNKKKSTKTAKAAASCRDARKRRSDATLGSDGSEATRARARTPGVVERVVETVGVREHARHFSALRVF